MKQFFGLSFKQIKGIIFIIVLYQIILTTFKYIFY